MKRAYAVAAQEAVYQSWSWARYDFYLEELASKFGDILVSFSIMGIDTLVPSPELRAILFPDHP